MTSDKLLVAAIDFGTTYSGYAFSTTAEYKDNPLKIHSNQAWVAGGKSLLSLKTPTCLLLDKNEKLVSFGYEAENTYSDLLMDDKAADYYYFQRFKMKLHQNSDLSKSTKVKDVTGKALNALDVFAKSISALKLHLMGTLENQATGIKPTEIQWVLTVPAIWSDTAKQFMRSAAEQAGIPGNQLKIALEPEAASMYCQHLPLDKLTGAGTGFSVTKKGTKYMVIDLGGGTADITVHEKLEGGKLKELYKASGGACGGTAVDSKFVQSAFIKVVGNPVMTDLAEQFPGSYLDLYREFETVKRTVTPTKEGKVNLTIPIVAINTVMEDSGETFKDALAKSTMSDKVLLLGDKLRIDAKMMKEVFFGEVIKEIVKHLEDILKRRETNGVSILLLVGGFSESPMVQAAIRKAFPDKRVIIPDEAGLSVLKGAVIYGHTPETITSRIIRYSYGARIVPDFNPRKHRNDKKCRIADTDRCLDVFSSFMKAGTSVPLHHKEISGYSTTTPCQTSMMLKIYHSPEESPEYTDDDDCEPLGEMEIEVPDPSNEERSLIVLYEFGDTELKVTAVEEKSKKPCRAEFKLL
ncbi:heat shock 70 kDa protein 12A-like [Mizuhopecten yessoensis]|uniref:Heat shock 70 kDa protein n=1 Tax=Mizuhopecten yessoensis TaxID=6573 RepID=A0A1C9U2X8_MIZYE|nr:heat shock 70 kDa protein 12A-like [Mizuhopecten yessoensis]AOR17341.1 heat shock 70 kDa protein [Mizuhopecten yessoensis]OWF52545.1 Heat shock 70 kDa protein 12B [Mizuhopecten yessoensis]